MQTQINAIFAGPLTDNSVQEISERSFREGQLKETYSQIVSHLSYQAVSAHSNVNQQLWLYYLMHVSITKQILVFSIHFF